MKIHQDNMHMGMKSTSKIIFEFTGTDNDRAYLRGEGVGKMQITPMWISWEGKDGSFQSKPLSSLIDWIQSGDK